MKVCSLYGAGFYYIPGTDVCLKLGGFLRTEWNIHANGSFATFFSGGNALQTRTEDKYITRARGYITTDVREQTSYGTLRAYLAAGWQFTSDDSPTISLPGTQATASSATTTFTTGGNSNLSLLRAFIQFGGFTFGKTASFYDFLNTSKYTLQTQLYQDYAGVGVFTYGYTQQLGNGIAATIAVQDQSPFVHPLCQFGGTQECLDFSAGGALPSTNNTAGNLVPDIVGAIRLDQAWGGAQVAAIAHDNRATYFAAPVPQTIGAPTFIPGNGANHPNDKWGFAVQGGIELNLDQLWGGWFSKGNSWVVQSQYCVGETYSCVNTGGTRLNDVMFSLYNPNKIGIGWADEAYFTGLGGADNGLQLATMWNVYTAIQHYWTPDVRTSLYGGFFSYQANSTDVDNFVCAVLNHGGVGGHTPGTLGTIHGSFAVSNTGCADWQAWQIGSRTLWNPVRNLDVGVDVLYTSMAKSAFEGATVQLNVPTSTAGVANVAVGDTHIWSGILRIQYNFYP